jgi:hypothetical protein
VPHADKAFDSGLLTIRVSRAGRESLRELLRFAGALRP